MYVPTLHSAPPERYLNMQHIRKATLSDANRLAEIEVFCYRLNFYPIFRNDEFYFAEMTVENLTRMYKETPELLDRTCVYDDGVVKGFVRISGQQVEKLFVEPVLQGQAIGAALLQYAVAHGCDYLWALEKNTRAIAFYQRHGFVPTGEKQYEEDTTEYLVRMRLR